MTAVLEETNQARVLMDRVEKLENVAHTLPAGDARRAILLAMVQEDLATARPMRPRIVADLLNLSEKTIRAWVDEGVLTRAGVAGPRVLLDPLRVHQVFHLVNELRAAGKTRTLLDEVYRRLVDATWLTRSDLIESLEQMRRGEGTTLVPKPAAE